MQVFQWSQCMQVFQNALHSNSDSNAESIVVDIPVRLSVPSDNFCVPSAFSKSLHYVAMFLSLYDTFGSRLHRWVTALQVARSLQLCGA